MRKLIWCVLGMQLASPAFAQTAATRVTSRSSVSAVSSTGSTRTRPSGTAARIKPDITVDTPIITLNGVCSQPTTSKTKAKTECKTVVTRGQLDALVALIDPEASLKSRQQFALSYARLLAATQLAEEKKVDENPAVAREIQFEQKLARMQVLTNYLLSGMQQQSQHFTDREIQEYYQKNESNFEQLSLRRLAIPLGANTESGKPVDPVAAKALMESLRESLLKGGDLDQLQARAYKEMGIKDALPPTTVSMERRQTHGPEEAKVFDLDMGETSPVFENLNVLLIVRPESKRTLSLQEATPQIEATLALQRIEDGIDKAFKGISAEFNLKYMDAKSQPDLVSPATVMQAGTGTRRGASSLMRQP